MQRMEFEDPEETARIMVAEGAVVDIATARMILGLEPLSEEAARKAIYRPTMHRAMQSPINKGINYG